MLTIENDGPRIVSSNYWDTPHAREGLLYLSVNARSFRLLVPDAMAAMIEEMRRGAKYVIVSQLPGKQWREREYCTELLFEDGSDSPFSLHLSPGQVDRALEEITAEDCSTSVWLRGPTLAFELLTRFRRVKKLPYLKPWGK